VTQLAHTSELDSATLKAVRVLLEDVFEGDWTDDDWDHTQGGVHALVWDGADLIGHAAVVQRRLLHNGKALRTGYIEGVAVRADRRNLGHGNALMEAMEHVIRGAYELGALSSSEAAAPLYAARGWKHWQGQTFMLSPNGLVRTEDEDDNTYVFPLTIPIDLTGSLTCDWRDGEAW
jgi:aminoglycoside 2'-N-acetyltransferase I